MFSDSVGPRVLGRGPPAHSGAALAVGGRALLRGPFSHDDNVGGSWHLVLTQPYKDIGILIMKIGKLRSGRLGTFCKPGSWWPGTAGRRPGSLGLLTYYSALSGSPEKFRAFRGIDLLFLIFEMGILTSRLPVTLVTVSLPRREEGKGFVKPPGQWGPAEEGVTAGVSPPTRPPACVWTLTRPARW